MLITLLALICTKHCLVSQLTMPQIHTHISTLLVNVSVKGVSMYLIMAVQ